MKRFEFVYQDKYEYAIFGNFRKPSLRCEEPNATIDIPVCF